MLSAAAAIAVSVPAVAQAPVRSERVQFARGASSTLLRGTIKGYQTIDYLLSARAGQTMTASLSSSNRSAYFNVLPPGSRDVAIFTGSTSGNRFVGRLPSNGDYRLRVYLMRGAARRGERADFGLSVAVTTRPGAGAPGPGPRPGTGTGQPVAPGNMAAYCRGEASAQYGVRPAYIATARLIRGRNGGSTIDGTADQGRSGIKRFRCRFDARGRFIDVMALTRDGE
ncbi:hypothetical protein [Novosphingobium sp. NRRL B-2648]|uniref:hypothetical protein n=1 Tax=Novosphingobium TaxID=165696 RepID=UPI002329AA54|nr:hypothetical protein GCM10017612_07320 [Novosphingobium resinovorum]